MNRNLTGTVAIALTAGLVSVLYNQAFCNEFIAEVSSYGFKPSRAGRLPRSLNANRHQQYEIAHRHENSSIADRLYKRVRVLCWVMTHPKNHREKADHVKATWGRRCNVLLFMSTERDNVLPTVKLQVKEGYDYLWAKTKAAFRYVYKNHRDDADWFLKADDDTYVILENLRLLLSNYSKNEPVYFGYRLKNHVPGGYMSGGAGYVLSREALYRFMKTALPNKTLCNDGDSGPEDVHIGECLRAVDVTRVDTRDKHQRSRFFPMAAERHLMPNNCTSAQWYCFEGFYKLLPGLDYASDVPISFHYVTPKQLYVLDFLTYHLRPYGLRRGTALKKGTKFHFPRKGLSACSAQTMRIQRPL